MIGLSMFAAGLAIGLLMGWVYRDTDRKLLETAKRDGDFWRRLYRSESEHCDKLVRMAIESQVANDVTKLSRPRHLRVVRGGK